MQPISTGDLAQSVYLQKQSSRIKGEIQKLTQELTSGRAKDTGSHLGGDMSYLGDVEHRLRVNAHYQTSTREATILANAMQAGLSKIQGDIEGLTSSLMTAGANGVSGLSQNAVSQEARFALDSITTVLNSSAAGRAVFAGSETDSEAIVDADAILSALETVVSGLTSAADVKAAVDNWFDAPGGGFDTLAYLGGVNHGSSFPLGEGETIDLKVKADDPAIRAALKAASLAALSYDESLGFSASTKTGLFDVSVNTALFAQDALTAIRSQVGFAEERLEMAGVRQQSTATSLSIAQSELLGADPYESAVSLEQAQFQLESIYTVTVRLAQLSLTRFM